MTTVPPPAVKPTDRPPLPPLHATPEWAAELEAQAALYGLPPEPWPLP